MSWGNKLNGGRPPAYDVPLSNFSFRVALDFSERMGGLTPEDVAKLLCINKQTVRYVERVALKKIRARFR